MKVLIPFTLDVKKTNVQKIIHANKGEGLDRKLQITLVNGSEPLILDSENQSVQFIANKPDGTTIYNSTAIKDGKVIIYLTSQTTAAVGDVDCQLEVVSTDEGSVGSGVIYSAKFTIAVEEALYDEDTVISSNEFTELIELIERAEKQVTVYQGEGTPSTDPDEFDNIKESDFYYDSTNKTYRYAKSVTTTISWETIVNGSELSNIVSNIYAELSAKANKTYVDTELAKKQNNLTDGNGIDLTNDTVSAKVSSVTDNALNVSSAGLYLSAYALGFNSYLRQTLVNSSVQNALASRAYVEEVALGLGNTLAVSINPTTYVMTLALKHGNEVLSTGSVDLPLETMVVGAEYDSQTKEIVLTLQSGSTVRFSVAALVSGLVSTDELEEILADYLTEDEITALLAEKQDKIDSTHKLDAALIQTNEYNNFVTLIEKSTWNAKQNPIDSTHKLDADLIEDGEVNKTVTAQEKSLWNSSHNVIIDSASGSSITLPDSTETAFNQIYLYGKSTQAGTPTIDSPIPITDTTAEEIEVTDGANTQTAELDITLRGIPVASGGNYTDANNQQWICDTIERYANGTGKLVQRVRVLTLNGSEPWTNGGGGGATTRLIATLGVADSTSADIKSIFEGMQLVASGNQVANTDNAYIIANGRMLCSPTTNGQRMTSVEQWVTFLQSNNLKLYSPLDTPIETPLTAEQIAELNLDAYYPETQITSTPDITVYYICDLKNYIDKISS